jgi:hypothetical protein
MIKFVRCEILAAVNITQYFLISVSAAGVQHKTSVFGCEYGEY